MTSPSTATANASANVAYGDGTPRTLPPTVAAWAASGHAIRTVIGRVYHPVVAAVPIVLGGWHAVVVRPGRRAHVVSQGQGRHGLGCRRRRGHRRGRRRGHRRR